MFRWADAIKARTKQSSLPSIIYLHCRQCNLSHLCFRKCYVIVPWAGNIDRSEILVGRSLSVIGVTLWSCTHTPSGPLGFQQPSLDPKPDPLNLKAEKDYDTVSFCLCLWQVYNWLRHTVKSPLVYLPAEHCRHYQKKIKHCHQFCLY